MAFEVDGEARQWQGEDGRHNERTRGQRKERRQCNNQPAGQEDERTVQREDDKS